MTIGENKYGVTIKILNIILILYLFIINYNKKNV